MKAVQVEVNHKSGSVWLLKTTLPNPNTAALLQTTVYLGLRLKTTVFSNIHQCHNLTSTDNTVVNHPAWLNWPNAEKQQDSYMNLSTSRKRFWRGRTRSLLCH